MMYGGDVYETVKISSGAKCENSEKIVVSMTASLGLYYCTSQFI
jgi:hypothetical protein